MCHTPFFVVVVPLLLHYYTSAQLTAPLALTYLKVAREWHVLDRLNKKKKSCLQNIYNNKQEITIDRAAAAAAVETVKSANKDLRFNDSES